MARQNEYYFLNLSNIRADMGCIPPPVRDLLLIPGTLSKIEDLEINPGFCAV